MLCSLDKSPALSVPQSRLCKAGTAASLGGSEAKDTGLQCGIAWDAQGATQRIESDDPFVKDPFVRTAG